MIDTKKDDKENLSRTPNRSWEVFSVVGVAIEDPISNILDCICKSSACFLLWTYILQKRIDFIVLVLCILSCHSYCIMVSLLLRKQIYCQHPTTLNVLSPQKCTQFVCISQSFENIVIFASSFSRKERGSTLPRDDNPIYVLIYLYLQSWYK